MSIQLGVARSGIQRYADRLKAFIAEFVHKTQAKIEHGAADDDWEEVEVDEVTLSKEQVRGTKYK